MRQLISTRPLSSRVDFSDPKTTENESPRNGSLEYFFSVDLDLDYSTFLFYTILCFEWPQRPSKDMVWLGEAETSY